MSRTLVLGDPLVVLGDAWSCPALADSFRFGGLGDC